MATIKTPFGADANNQGQITSLNVGTVGTATGLSVVEYGDGYNHVAEITLDGVAVGSAVATAALAFGVLLYTLPAGAQVIDVVHMNVALTGTTTIVADTPDLGIGSVIGSGVVAVLGGTATFEDYITGQTSGAISGANYVEAMSAATAGALTGIALNISTSTKAIYLNCADTWAGAGDVTASGVISISYRTME